MLNCYFDMHITIRLDEDIEYKEQTNYLSRIINESFLNDNVLKKKHKEKQIKGYVFSYLHPIEKDNLYKKGKTYVFNINSQDFTFCSRLKDCLENNKNIKAINIRIKEMKRSDTLISTSPCITSFENARYWRIADSISFLYQQIDKNTKHKARLLFNYDKKILDKSENFIETIVVKNTKDIVLNYKNTKLVGYSIELKIKQDNISQFLANVCLAVGIGEKNSLGFGYCVVPFKEKRKEVNV